MSYATALKTYEEIETENEAPDGWPCDLCHKIKDPIYYVDNQNICGECKEILEK